MIARLSPSCSFRRRITFNDSSCTGAPDRPPASSACAWPATASRDSVVLVAITPSMPWRGSVSAMASICSCVRSGAIFTAMGTRRWCWSSKARRLSANCASSADSSSPLCSARRFLVFGDEIFTVT
ncbi:hypothetical protein D3C72_1985010 [compost metagenome]